MSNRPTPLTDVYYRPNGESIRRIHPQDGYEFARRLERDRAELIEALQQLDNLRMIVVSEHKLGRSRPIKQIQKVVRTVLARMKEDK